MSPSKPAQSIPERTGAVFFVRVACRELKQMSIDNGMSIGRLCTDGGVFFFDRDRFDSALLGRGLRRNEQVVIGAHRLRDGSAWLHWLGRDNGDIWAPEPDRRPWLAPLTLVLSPLPVVAALALPAGVNIFVVLLQIVLFSIAGFSLLWAVYRLVVLAHPGRRRVARGLQAFRAGELAALHEPPTLRTPDTLQLADGLHGKLGVLQDTLSSVDVVFRTYGSGRTSYSVHEYRLACAGEIFSLRTGAWELRRFIDPALIRRAPLFLAAGDHVSLLSLVADGEVRGLLNASDGLAHVTYKGTGTTPMARRFILGLAGFFMVLLPILGISFEIYDWYDRGVGPDYWDWLDLVTLNAGMLLIVTLILCGLGLIGEIAHRVYLRHREERPIEKILGIAFAWRLRAGRSPTINEFF
ncbi:hypothetical protein [Salinisphaera aquimarina]|uniref:Uncharacterized protein n=1 Tax=Salinisphaera aquimarina TaxID=2094031 RepID=A0ABV7END6_9GAMM